uniref:Propionyl-CoA carboxylase alpha chain, mitochondrial n=1 Tax=Timema cristinae TaxID=61476 RepID=A0A7R9D4V5_TIMCR|nr:unnamed protein product [Timema cristinae]
MAKLIYKNASKTFTKCELNQVLMVCRQLTSLDLYDTDPINIHESRFDKILVANRGEIACRVIGTARQMGIKTVAVYSLADYNSRHVFLADEAVCIGPAPSTQSYLNIDKLLEAVKQTKSQAVHPGYGFLSENATFVQALEREGVAFIGPSVDSINGMGDKLESKRLAAAAGDAEHCVFLAREIGYPVMVKASAGGGGKGMRIARNDDEAREGFRLSTQEAASSFGDDRMIIEKFVDKPRHIEIQVLGDKHGNAIFLNERECSIQRRNQKVIEEAPSTFLDTWTRTAMGQQAVALCKRLGYYSAGTVEFLVDSQRNFYFLEMNTRLQVEHPITECITGIDLVHQMIRVAKGHPLRLTQKDVPLRGWAIESRVYSEDPYRNFGLPSTGRLTKYQEPLHIPKVRCDSGVEEGSEISIYYDPMICKLVCYGNTRKEAINTSIKALDSYVIRGVAHNIPLLRDILTEPNFVEGNLTTDYLNQVYPEGFKGRQLGEKETLNLAAVAATLCATMDLRSRNFLNSSSNKIKSQPLDTWSFVVAFLDQEVLCQVKKLETKFKVQISSHSMFLSDKFNLSSSIINIEINDQPVVMQLVSKDETGHMQLTYQGTTFKISVLTETAARFLHVMPQKLKEDVSKVVKSPMPGMVKSVNCKHGDDIAEGQEVCVIGELNKPGSR